VNNETIPWQLTAKYLGLTFDNRLSWKPHIDKTRHACNKTLNALYPILKDQKLNRKNKLLLYKQVIRPKLLYGSTTLGTVAKSTLESLQRHQNLTLRKIFAIPWYIRNADIQRDLKVDPVKKFIRDRALKLFDQRNANGTKTKTA